MGTRSLLVETPDAIFAPPDTGHRRTPYACTFHWLPVGGRIVGLDVIRSEDSGKLGLRVFAFAGGVIRALVHEAPAVQWAPFAHEPPDLDGDRDVLGRGRGWVAGSVRAPGQSLARVRFSFQVQPAGPGVRLRPSLDRALRLRAIDYLDARTTGFIELDGQRLTIDARGPVSVHHGLQLTRYGYAAAVPPGPQGVRLVAATVGGDTARIGRSLLKAAGVTYVVGAQGLPDRALHVGRPRRDLELGGGRRLVLEQVHAFPHRLLGEPTVTAFARAHVEGGPAGTFDVVLDHRGEPYASLLA